MSNFGRWKKYWLKFTGSVIRLSLTLAVFPRRPFKTDSSSKLGARKKKRRKKKEEEKEKKKTRSYDILSCRTHCRWISFFPTTAPEIVWVWLNCQIVWVWLNCQTVWVWLNRHCIYRICSCCCCCCCCFYFYVFIWVSLSVEQDSSFLT